MKIVNYTFPILATELLSLGEMMRSRDVLTPGFDKQEGDAYHPMIYVREKELHLTQTQLLVDRNLMTRWVSLGKSCIASHEHRLAAATLAFCQCCDILIEPNIALYELAANQGNQAAHEEETAFRIVDNTAPQLWVDIALGRVTQLNLLSQSETGRKNAEIDYCTPLKVWRRFYVLALKVAALSLQSGPAHILLERLFEWMHAEYLFLAPGTIMALCYFAPNSPKKGLLKQIRSADRDNALSGIKNATWDLTLVSEWIKMVHRQRESNTLALLGSLDTKLHTVARNILAFSDSDEVIAAKSRQMVDSLWGSDMGERLHSQLREYERDADNPARRANQLNAQPSLERLIDEGEQEIRSWRS
jgi:hypothetical protein